MIEPYPSIDSRRTKKLVAELKRLAEVFVPTMRDITMEDNVEHAVVEIAARLAGQVTQRLDKVPRRDVIAFFHTLDLPQEAPLTARAPLVFTLSEKREKPVHAPARIQVAASGKNGEEVIFETISALNLTPARMDHLVAVDSKQDLIEEPPPQFFQLAPAQPQTQYHVVTLADAGSDTLQISPAIGLEAGDVIGIDNETYRIKKSKDGLVTLVEQDRLEVTVNANTAVRKVTRFDAFELRNLQRHVFYVGHKELLNLEQPSTIRLGVLPSNAASSLVSLKLTITIFGTKENEEEPDWHPLDLIGSDGNELLLFKPWLGTVDEVEVHGRKNRWLRIELEQPINVTQPSNTRIASFALRVESGKSVVQTVAVNSNWCFEGEQDSDKKEAAVLCIPCEVGEQEGSQTIKKAFHNITPLPLSTRFAPFGTEPLRFDTFALAAPEALSKKGAKVALAINLVDATPAVFALALSSPLQKHAYAIGVNGRLQVLELSETESLEGGILDRWQELGHPDKLPEDNAGSSDVNTLRLDTSRLPQVVQIKLPKQGESFDLVVVGDQGGRFWVTKVMEKSSGSDVFTRSDWEIIPPLPISDVTKITDLVLLPYPAPSSEPVEPKPSVEALSNHEFTITLIPYIFYFKNPGAFLFAVTDQGFYSLNISTTGLPFSEWQSYSPSENFKSSPSFYSEENPGALPRLVPILSHEFPSPPGSFPFGLVLLDADGKFWHGSWNWFLFKGKVEWKLLTTEGDPVLASPEVRPVAAKLDSDSFVLFAADQEKRALFSLVGPLNGSSEDIMLEKRDLVTEFIVQAETELLYVPDRLNENKIEPIALAFGEKNMGLWLGDKLLPVEYPAGSLPGGKSSGILVPINKLPPLILINGQRERLYWTLPVQIASVQPDPKIDGADLAINNWVAESFPSSDQNPELSWEYFDGDGWQRLDQGFNDTTGHLAVSGRICFCVPNDIAPTEIAGQEDYWLRARLVGGDYGRAKYVVTTTPDGEDDEITTQSITIDTSGLRAPEILSIDACFEMTETVAPQQVLTENNRAVLDQTKANSAASAQFEIFEGAAAIDTKLGLEELGRALYLGFTKPYDVNPLTLFINADEPLDPDDQLETFELLFEVLELDECWRKVAADDRTGGFQHRGIVNLFVDITPQRVRLFGRDLFWLRVRPMKNGDQWTPLLNGIYINAADAEQARSVKQEILGASSGEPDQRFFLSKTPVIANSLELRVREALSEDERLELEQAKEIRLNMRQPESEFVDIPVIEKYPDIPGEWVLWRQVDSFVEKDGDARVYQLDPTSGAVRFGNDKQGKIPPAGRDAVRAIGYQNGGGEVGNVDAFSIEGLKSSVESVDSVTNPIAAVGGVDTLDIDLQIATAPDRLRHRQQALTPLDIEALAVSWSPEIVRARCDPPLEPNDPIKVFVARRTGERCPKATLVERDALARYLLEQGWGALDDGAIRVYNPDYVHVSVTVDIIAESSEKVAMVEKEARERLLKLLHPITGGSDGTGWPFGRGLWKSDLFRALAGVSGLDRVKNVELKPDALDILSPSSLICAEEIDVKVIVNVDSGVS